MKYTKALLEIHKDNFNLPKSWNIDSEGVIESFIGFDDESPNVDKSQLAELLAAIIRDIKEKSDV